MSTPKYCVGKYETSFFFGPVLLQLREMHCNESLIFLFLKLSGYEGSSNRVLEIKSTSITSDQSLVFYKVDETLNLTCIFKNESILPDVVLEWVVQSKAPTSQNRITYRRGTNFVVLMIENLQESDSGEYKCKAVHNGTPFFNSESSVRIKVKNKKRECTDVMFQCSAGICIHKRYTCDGFRDCPHGEDESPNYCGPGNPCDNKLMCPDYRCIPFTWCCESHREPNCTTKVKHSCCTHVEKLTRDVDNDMGFQFEQQRFSDMGFLQTTVYTVIGCAMAFMFIVTIIVIAICRVHVRRTLLSRCPAAARHLALGRGANVHGNNLGGWSFYDLDLYFNRAGLSRNDLMSVNPLLVTYNINNGVQFVGRPIDPPPYCEIVTSPPKEGPPPPYASHENLCLRREDGVGESKHATTTPESEDTESESDALLDAAQNGGLVGCRSTDIVPSIAADTSNPSQTRNSTSGENCGKECSEPGYGCDASRCANSNKHVEESKDCSVNIITVDKSDSGAPGAVKIHVGESSSHAPSDLSEVSKGAVRKLYSSKSLDSNFRKKNKPFSVHTKKF